MKISYLSAAVMAVFFVASDEFFLVTGRQQGHRIGYTAGVAAEHEKRKIDLTGQMLAISLSAADLGYRRCADGVAHSDMTNEVVQIMRVVVSAAK